MSNNTFINPKSEASKKTTELRSNRKKNTQTFNVCKAQNATTTKS